MTAAGVGSEEVFALNALAGSGDRACLDTFRYKLETATHLETRLAAVRGLGLLGSDEGLEVARRGLRVNRLRVSDPNDTPEGQVLRIRQLAAAALGAIGRTDALFDLEAVMNDPRDPRIQISAAKAILEILEANRKTEAGFPATAKDK